MMSATPAERTTLLLCGCACGHAEPVEVRSGAVTCRTCNRLICPDCCVAVPVVAEYHKVEFTCDVECARV